MKVQSAYAVYISQIIRVTKTTAFGNHPTREKDEVCKFNIDISLGVHEKPKSKYNSINNDLII